MQRAPSQDWIEDPQALTVLITGESTAVGHGLQWEETFAAKLGRTLRLQVVNVAEGGYGGDGFSNVGGVVFDPTTNRLYVLAEGAVPYGRESAPEMYVYQVGPPPLATSP